MAQTKPDFPLVNWELPIESRKGHAMKYIGRQLLRDGKPIKDGCHHLCLGAATSARWYDDYGRAASGTRCVWNHGMKDAGAPPPEKKVGGPYAISDRLRAVETALNRLVGLWEAQPHSHGTEAMAANQ